MYHRIALAVVFLVGFAAGNLVLFVYSPGSQNETNELLRRALNNNR